MIDTRNKRASAIGVGLAGLLLGGPPAAAPPDGGVGFADRAALVGGYGGIEPAVVVGGPYEIDRIEVYAGGVERLEVFVGGIERVEVIG